MKMILIQDGSQNTNVDKPLRIIGDPYKVQQACEMVMDILRERDQGGFGDRNEYGSRVGGGIDVSASTSGRWAARSRADLGAHQVTLSPGLPGACTQAFSWCSHWPEWRDDQEDPE